MALDCAPCRIGGLSPLVVAQPLHDLHELVVATIEEALSRHLPLNAK